MKFSSLVTSGFAVLLGLFSINMTWAQSAAAVAARDYSFTISTAQPWTDTGVDLQAGQVLEINSSSAASCDPAGMSGAASSGLPVVSAPAGALIARLQSQGVPVLIGNGNSSKSTGPAISTLE